MSDTLLENVSALVGEMQGLARQAHAQYVVEVDGVIAARSRGARHIERLLDGILDFGYIDISAVSSQLRRGGCEAIFPLALALNSPRMD